MRPTLLISVLLLSAGCSSGAGNSAGAAVAKAARATASAVSSAGSSVVDAITLKTPQTQQEKRAAAVAAMRERVAKQREANQARVAGTSPF